jgi:DNA repair exonuclease SbcCD nuclease subunit
MIIIVGDVHFRSKEPFLTGLHGILQHLISHYKNEIIIFTGDFLHTSSPHWDIIDIAIKYLLQFKEVYILEGNHDSSYIKGKGLTAFKHLPTIHIIEEKTEITIEGQNFLFLPHTENVETLKSYEKLTGSYDYVVTHLTHKKVQFRNEGISFNMKAKAIIHGHIHTQFDFFDDENGNQFNCIIGVPQFVNSGEENQIYRIAKIDGSRPGHGIEFESLPVFTTLETVEYGTMPSNKNNYINVINAPSVSAVKEMYKGYYIRNEGISLKRTPVDEKDIQKVELDFSSKLLEKFIAFAKSKVELPKEVMDCGIHYINLVAPSEESITETSV